MSQSTIASTRARPIAKLSLAVLLTLAVVYGRVEAAAVNAADVVRGFYATLLSTMMNGPQLGPSGRYARLEPVIRQAFDVALMTRLAVGPSWNSLSSTQQQQVTAAFERYVAATYADRFDGYSGERLEVAGEQPFASGIVVQTRIVKSDGEPVRINYLMRRNGEAWQVSDVYLDGTISELATRRSEFSSILRDRGVDGLITTLNRKADLLSATTARAS